jgi:16S rRNA (guanine1516-N2)-methyltransferase
MVKVLTQSPVFEKLTPFIQQALLLTPEVEPGLILHLNETKHVLEKITPSDCMQLHTPYEEPQFLQRLKRSSPSEECLLKAIGCKKNERPSVIDATAGFGVESLLMAYHHCQVSCIEWNPLVCFLAAQGLTKVSARSDYAFINQYLTYYHHHAAVLIPELPPHDVIYLDPMFPERRKQAQVKKYMQLMQILSTLYPWTQCDSLSLFEVAKAHAIKRVVVKRPKTQPPLVPHPNHSISTNTIRFDVYTK